MFDPHQIEEYRAVQAPASLKARIEAAATPKPSVLKRVIPWMAAAAACLVLFVVGTAMFQTPPLSATATACVTTARTAQRQTAVTLTLLFDGTFTLSEADEGLLQEDGQPLTLPLTAQDRLTLLWTFDEPSTTVTVNGHTYTLHLDPVTSTVTVS